MVVICPQRTTCTHAKNCMHAIPHYEAGGCGKEKWTGRLSPEFKCSACEELSPAESFIFRAKGGMSATELLKVAHPEQIKRVAKEIL